MCGFVYIGEEPPEVCPVCKVLRFKIRKIERKTEEVHAALYQEALDNLDNEEEVTYYLCPVYGNIERFVPDKCSICGVPGNKFIKY